jgi:hypothetical protein
MEELSQNNLQIMLDNALSKCYNITMETKYSQIMARRREALRQREDLRQLILFLRWNAADDIEYEFWSREYERLCM